MLSVLATIKERERGENSDAFRHISCEGMVPFSLLSFETSRG